MLCYTTSLVGMRFRLMGDHVRIERISSHSSELPRAEIPVPEDFADGRHGPAEQLLEAVGFDFSSGGSAAFVSEKGVLFLRGRRETLLRGAEWARYVAWIEKDPGAVLETARLLLALERHYRSRDEDAMAERRLRQVVLSIHELDRRRPGVRESDLIEIREQLERLGKWEG